MTLSDFYVSLLSLYIQIHFQRIQYLVHILLHNLIKARGPDQGRIFPAIRFELN